MWLTVAVAALVFMTFDFPKKEANFNCPLPDEGEPSGIALKIYGGFYAFSLLTVPLFIVMQLVTSVFGRGGGLAAWIILILYFSIFMLFFAAYDFNQKRELKINKHIEYVHYLKRQMEENQ